jgi:hypothetical protein
LIYRRTGISGLSTFCWAIAKIESTVRYLGVEVDYALTIAEQVDV